MKQQHSSGNKKHSLKIHIYTARNKTCYITKENILPNTNIYTTLNISTHAIYSTLETICTVYIPDYTRYTLLPYAESMRFLYIFTLKLLAMLYNTINVYMPKVEHLPKTIYSIATKGKVQLILSFIPILLIITSNLYID